jgi:hypothetical protein
MMMACRTCWHGSGLAAGNHCDFRYAFPSPTPSRSCFVDRILPDLACYLRAAPRVHPAERSGTPGQPESIRVDPSRVCLPAPRGDARTFHAQRTELGAAALLYHDHSVLWPDARLSNGHDFGAAGNGSGGVRCLPLPIRRATFLHGPRIQQASGCSEGATGGARSHPQRPLSALSGARAKSLAEACGLSSTARHDRHHCSTL